MPSHYTLLACVIFLASSMATTHAQTALELTDRASKDLQAFADAKKEEIIKAEDARRENPTAANPSDLGANHQAEFGLRNDLSTLQSVRKSLETGNDENALLELSHLDPFGHIPAEMRPTLDALRQRIRHDQTEKLAAYTKDTASTLQRATAAIQQAKEAKDLDESLKDLRRASELRMPSSSYTDERNATNRLLSAVTFVTRWQDYLIARSRNDDTEVRNILRGLTAETSVPLVARSEILARIPQTDTEREAALRARRAGSSRSGSQIDADARQIVQGLQKLEEVAPALVKLVDLRTEETDSSRNYRGDSVLSAALQGLDSLQRSILEYRNGLTPDVGHLLSRTEYAAHPEISLPLWSLRLQLVREAAPHLMGVPAEEKPGEAEPVGVYLCRLIESAKERQDWAAVIEGLRILRMLTATENNYFGNGNDQDISAYQNLLAASNLEKAGQYGEAVTLYLSALRTGQQNLPATWIGQHLTDIQKAHPGEYARGQGRSSDDTRAAYLEMLREYQSVYGVPPSGAPNGASPAAPPDSKTASATPSPSPAANAVTTPTATPSPTAPAVVTPTP